jgi:hypothetical protein
MLLGFGAENQFGCFFMASISSGHSEKGRPPVKSQSRQLDVKRLSDKLARRTPAKASDIAGYHFRLQDGAVELGCSKGCSRSGTRRYTLRKWNRDAMRITILGAGVPSARAGHYVTLVAPW